MTDIRTLVPAAPGWRVAVACAYPALNRVRTVVYNPKGES